MQLHSTPLQVSKTKNRNPCMLIWEMLHDFIILTTFLLYLFNQGDFHESFLFFSKAKDRKLKFTGALERSMMQIMARVVSGIMEHLREELKSSPQFKTNLATLGISD